MLKYYHDSLLKLLLKFLTDIAALRYTTRSKTV